MGKRFLRYNQGGVSIAEFEWTDRNILRNGVKKKFIDKM